ncbi:hypothetical protein IJX73_01740 [bacterium]|nr:hypothetical protein [bacterium]MBQ9149631.1 hypothetical protein [bacterium]
MKTSGIRNFTKPIINRAAKAGNWAANKLGTITSGDSKLAKGISKGIDLFEPTGGDNSFFGLASIMTFAVLFPRIKSALKRNPDNKEATKDEITEILFRDVQTILIMLFGLKTMNSVVSNLGTKITGIPMVDKPFRKMFSNSAKGFTGKVKEFAQQPIQKIKTIGLNTLDALNPIGGSSSLNGSKVNTLYTNYSSHKEVKKLIEDVPSHGGDKEKVFNKIKKSIAQRLDDKITLRKSTLPYDSLTGKYSESAQRDLDGLSKAREYFQTLEYGDFMSEDFQMPKGYEQELVDFFADKNNSLAKTARNVNDWLRTGALGIEISYLGFGLPALNQKRLERKYLKNPCQNPQIDSFSPINDRHIKAQEIKLYSNFIK